MVRNNLGKRYCVGDMRFKCLTEPGSVFQLTHVFPPGFAPMRMAVLWTASGV